MPRDKTKYSSSIDDTISLLQTTAALRRRLSCPAEVYSLHAGSIPHKKTNFTRVMLADFPSTGSTWLKQLLAATATAQNIGNPSCAIYPEGQCGPSRGVYCACDGYRSDQDAGLIKSHYPAQELYNQSSIASTQYSETMKYDRIVQLVRHPIASINSNMNRWGGSAAMVRLSLHCWGAWWERAKEKAGHANVLLLHYEDLCLNTTSKVHEVLQFLGGSFASISLADVGSSLAKRPDLDSRYNKNDLNSQTQAAASEMSDMITSEDKDLMSRWGYRTDGTSEWAGSGPSQLLGIGPPQVQEVWKRGILKDQRNPWSEIW
jgi:hypothetical protein